MKLLTAAQMRQLPSCRRVAACGIVTARQQPPTAKGDVFITLEDETSIVNVIVWKSRRKKHSQQALKSCLLAVYRVWQRNSEQINTSAAGNVKNTDNAAANRGKNSQGEVCHLVAQHPIDLTHLLGELATQSREFH